MFSQSNHKQNHSKSKSKSPNLINDHPRNCSTLNNAFGFHKRCPIQSHFTSSGWQGSNRKIASQNSVPQTPSTLLTIKIL